MEEEKQESKIIHTYRCKRCEGVFDSRENVIVQCPYCAMLCDAGQCRIPTN